MPFEIKTVITLTPDGTLPKNKMFFLYLWRLRKSVDKINDIADDIMHDRRGRY